MTSRTANMAFAFTDEQAMILDSAKSFCADKSDIGTVRSLINSENGYNQQVWSEMVELGWTGIAIPEQYGGSELGIGSTVALVESMGRHLLSTPFLATTLASQAILRGGSDQHKSHWLPEVAEGSIGTLALLDSEDWGATSTSCNLSESQDKLVLEGSKLLVCDAAVANFFIVSANYNGAQVLVLVAASSLKLGCPQQQSAD
jgi:alkylation response protein AidB-like acyl-CoA dehydrogenase